MYIVLVRKSCMCYTLTKRYKFSGQDGSIGRYTLPPHTTKRRTTTNLNTKNNQHWQKTELYVSPTTNKLKKKHSFILVGGAETGSQGGEDPQQGSGWWTRQYHMCEWISWEEQLGSNTDCATQGSITGKESLKTSGWKNLWGLQLQEKLPVSKESLMKGPTGF